MKAIETAARIDEKGILQLDKPLQITNKRVKIIILLPDDADASHERIPAAAPIDVLNEPTENTYTLPDEKLLSNVTREIKRLPKHLLPDLQKIIAGLLAKRQQMPEKRKELSYEERLKELMDAAKYLTEKEDFDQYMKDFEESTQDRPLPFREP